MYDHEELEDKMAESSEFVDGETLVYDSSNHGDGTPELRLLHFNDVYHVTESAQEPVGGLARFATLCREYHESERFRGQPTPLSLFSGDAFNPSLESIITKGAHMVPALHKANVRAACLGNHDLDFGTAHFQHLASQCNFPWLCANVFDPALGKGVPIGNCQRSTVLTADSGIKIGLIGLVEQEWLDTIDRLPPNLEYRSAPETAAELAPCLRAQGADIIICLTHQREPNDIRLAETLPLGTIDLILGGHDHFYNHVVVNGVSILRSGTDFKQLSHLEGWRTKFDDPNGLLWQFRITRRDVTRSIPEDPDTVWMVKKITAELAPRLAKPVGHTAVPLDARFVTVRKRESNLANFICDIMRLHFGADCCIMAGGTVRGDVIYPPGVLTVKDLMDCFPFEDPCVLVKVKGKDIVAALENGVSKYPALEGRFPQVSGITFAFDPSLPPGARCSAIMIAGSPIDHERWYTAAARDYMVRGHDGYSSMMLKEQGGPAEPLVDEEGGILLSQLLHQYFKTMEVVGQWKTWLHHPARRVNGNKTALISSTALDSIDVNTTIKINNATSIASRVTALEKKRCSLYSERPGYRRIKSVISRSSYQGVSSNANALAKSKEQLQVARERFTMRRYICKWWRLAGLPANPNLCEYETEKSKSYWSCSISPRIEGRIVQIGAIDNTDACGS